MDQLIGEMRDNTNVFTKQYFKIIKVDLTHDVVLNVYLSKDQEDDYNRAGSPVSKWFQEYAENGNVHPDDLPGFQSYCRLDYLRNAFRRNCCEKTILYRRQADGLWRYAQMELTAAREYRDDHQVVMFYIVDVHELYTKAQAAQKELEKAVSVAHEADKSKTAFISRLRSDLGTPVDALLGLTNLALMSRDEDEVKELLNQIRRMGNDLKGLVDGIASMTQENNETLGIHVKSINLNEMFEEFISLIEHELKAKHVTITSTNFHMPYCNVLADSLKLWQVFRTLILVSAEHAGEYGNLYLEAEQKQSEDGKYTFTTLLIFDDADPRSDYEIEHFFDEEQPEDMETTMSTLARAELSYIVQLFHRLSGRLEVCVRENRNVILATVKQLSQNISEDKGAAERDERSNYSKMSFLVVEDQMEKRKECVDLLTSLGIHVDDVANGMQAIELLTHTDRSYDAIFMDTQMPVLNGYEATEKIRNGGYPFSDIPIVAMTSNAFYETVNQAMQSGMNSFIPKPLEKMAVLMIVERIINHTI